MNEESRREADAEGRVRQEGWRLGVKRAVDVCVAGSVLAVTAPLLGATAAAVALTMGRPVLFSQERLGRGGRVFTIRKFRTMRPATSHASPDGDAARITRLGRIMRQTSIDELPQLLNVLRGDMSLVGPRPLLVRYGPRYSPRQARRHDVLPGLTGWAQIHGRNGLSWAEKFEHDVWYVDNWHPLLDLGILARTAATVVSLDGVSASGHATMPEFLGEQDHS